MGGDDIKRKFGRSVQELRERNGLTQEQLGERIGRSVDTISNIERGVNATRIETANQLASALGVGLPDLFAFDEGPASSTRERRQALAGIRKLLTRADDRTLLQLKVLLEVGLRLATADGK